MAVFFQHKYIISQQIDFLYIRVLIDLPCFEDSDINALLDELPKNATISIRGVAGSGKSLVGECILESVLGAGQNCRYLIIGSQEDGREALNRATGTGFDLLSYIPCGRLSIDVVEEPSLHTMLYTLAAFRDIDLLMIDPLSSAEGIDHATAERALSWFGNKHEISVICISQDGVGDPRPYADLMIDMYRAGEEVESLNADAILSAESDDRTVERAFLVKGYGLRMDEYE